MWKWLTGLYYARLRRLDIEILWPQCRDQARDLDHAKTAFVVHAYRDPAWLFLGADEIDRIIDNLS